MVAKRYVLSLTLAMVIGAAGCGGGSSYTYGTAPTAPPTSAAAPATSTSAPATSTLTLTSDAFVNNGEIPVKYSCSGDGTSPALSWSGAPAGTQTFALIVHDPDAPLAGGFTHWMIIDLPANTASLPAGILAGQSVNGGGQQLIGYRGMCPPLGATAHHYHFALYALDAPLNLTPDKSRDEVIAAMSRHTLAMTEIVGLFGR